MNFLKNLFGGGGGKQADIEGRSMYLYVKPNRCDDVVRVRVDLNNDLSLNDEGSGYWVRKMVSSSNYKCTQVELNVYFDMGRRLQETETQGGQLVTRDDYEQWVAAQQTPE